MGSHRAPWYARGASAGPLRACRYEMSAHETGLLGACRTVTGYMGYMGYMSYPTTAAGDVSGRGLHHRYRGKTHSTCCGCGWRRPRTESAERVRRRATTARRMSGGIQAGRERASSSCSVHREAYWHSWLPSLPLLLMAMNRPGGHSAGA